MKFRDLVGLKENSIVHVNSGHAKYRLTQFSDDMLYWQCYDGGLYPQIKGDEGRDTISSFFGCDVTSYDLG